MLRKHPPEHQNSTVHFKLIIDRIDICFAAIDLGNWGGTATNSRMKTKTTASIGLRTLFTLVLLPLLGFCVFGILATFEPLPPETQWLWRGIYGSIGAGCLFGIARLMLPLARKSG